MAVPALTEDQQRLTGLEGNDETQERTAKTQAKKRGRETNCAVGQSSSQIMTKKRKTLPYAMEEILKNKKYQQNDCVVELRANDFSVDYIDRTGLLRPLLFNVPPEQLGMNMPDPQKFSVSDVLELIGGERSIEVVDVYEQTGSLKPLKEFIDYYKKPQSERTELWNALSLEFTSTKLAEQVSAPTVVSEIDWIDNVWPKHLFDPPDAAVNNDSSTYPKVQKYCLMSVANCFTDFHIDFGGTSVWYHILKGEKIFWLIAPTEYNLQRFERWHRPGQKSCFFGELVEKCAAVRLYSGHTLIIPSGWIHAVYTPVDSLAFGGNFLHSYAIPMQLRISETEKIIKPVLKYRFPHFKQIFWCYIASIVLRSTSRIYQKKLTAEALQLLTDAEEICYDESLGKVDVYNPIQLGFSPQDKPKFFTPTQRYNLDYLRKLSPFEIFGLESLAHYADKLLRSTQPEVIEGITRPCHLVKEFRAVISKINELGLVSTQRSTAETAQSDDKIRQLEEENRELKSALLAKPELPAQVRSEQAGKEDGRGGDQGGGFGRPEI